MSNSRQRFKLGELYHKGPHYYHATFDHITHKVNQQHKKIPVILLKDIYLVNENDKKIRLANKNDFKDKKGRHIIADHIWIKLTKPWLMLPKELIQGDEVIFQAEVEQYKIVRKDVNSKREQIYLDAKKKNDEIWKRWSKYTDTHKRKNFQLSLEKMKQKQRDNLAQAKRKQNDLKLVDYSLNKISKLKVVNYLNTAYSREQYNWQQYKRQGYKYSAWLAARSMAYCKK